MVVFVGCPLDSDKDGVYDSFDKCPNGPKGFVVDKDGCEVSVSLMINFDTNKSIVKEQYFGEIEKVANFMKVYPNIKVEIAGHTDIRGSREKNLKLSQDRANAVMEILVNKYVDKSRVSAKGYGPDKPIGCSYTTYWYFRWFSRFLRNKNRSSLDWEIYKCYFKFYHCFSSYIFWYHSTNEKIGGIDIKKGKKARNSPCCS